MFSRSACDTLSRSRIIGYYKEINFGHQIAINMKILRGFGAVVCRETDNGGDRQWENDQPRAGELTLFK